MNKVRNYYWYIGAPVAAVVAGAVVFLEPIIATVKGNPHPQINYIIFGLIAAGCAMMIGHVWRMNRDAKFVERFFEQARSGSDAAALRALLESSRQDSRAVLELVSDMIGKPVSPVQHAALEAEQHRYQVKQARYLTLPQFMSGMMVGLGLFGTFIGLLGALAEIGKLVGAFSVTMGGDPVEAIRVLVERLTAPMQAMGVAFSASLFGVLGSLIMGILQVGVRNCSGELVALLDTRVTYLIDFNAEGASTSSDLANIGGALGDLAEQAPVLRTLCTALDQSERRVRDLVNAMVQLTSRIDVSERHSARLVELLAEAEKRDAHSVGVLEETSKSIGRLGERWVAAEHTEEKIHSLLVAQAARQGEIAAMVQSAQLAQQQVNAHLADTLSKVQGGQESSVERLAALSVSFEKTATQLEVGLRDLAGVQRRGTDQLIDTLQNEFKDMAGLQRKLSETLAESTLSGLRDLAGAHRRASEEAARETFAALSGLTEAVESQKNDQRSLGQQITRLNDVLAQFATQNLASVASLIESHQRRQGDLAQVQSDSIERLGATLQQSLGAYAQLMEKLDRSVELVTSSVQAEALSSAQLVNRLELKLQESSDRQLQLVEQLVRAIEDNRLVTAKAA